MNLDQSEGDISLKTVANKLRECVNTTDFLAHLGGDEFAVIVDGNDDKELLKVKAETIRDYIHRQIKLENDTVNVSVSMGITIYPNDGTKPHTLVKNAI